MNLVATLKQFPIAFEKRSILNRVSYELVYKTFGLIMTHHEVDMSWTQYRPNGCRVNFYKKPGVV